MKKNRVDPKRIVTAMEDNFKDVLTKPSLKNMILVVIAMSLADKLKINEIARKLPTDVSHQRVKQTRLLRILKRIYPLVDMMFSWTRFVVKKVYGGSNDAIMILIDGVSLKYDYKAFVAAIPYRKRSIPLMFKMYTDQQIRDMVYLSENWIIWKFMDQIYDSIQCIFPGRRVIFVFDRGFADEKLIRYLKYMGANHIMRVPKNVGIEAFEYRGKLSSFGQLGYFRNIKYHLGKQLELNLFCGQNPKDEDDPVFIISDLDDALGELYKKRMDIEEGFRDIKTLFGFRQLVLKKPTQSRIEILFLLAIISMGLLFLLFEKSGYRWSKFYNTSYSKEFSLIHVIKEKIKAAWGNLRVSPWFSLNHVRFYNINDAYS